MSAAFRVAFNDAYDNISSKEKAIQELSGTPIIKRQPNTIHITAHRVGGEGPYHTAIEYNGGEVTQ